MRYHLLVLALLAGTAAPALAQAGNEAKQVERRLERIEQELRAVQRRVFPGGNVEPEISSAAQPGTTSGLPATTAVADITARLDAVESQLAALTNQAEANENRIRQAEAAMTNLRQSLDARLDQLEARPSDGPATGASAATTTSTIPNRPTATTGGGGTGATRPTASAGTTITRPAAATTTGSAATVDSGDAEEAYNTGFRLWEQQRYPDAEQALEAMIGKYPRSRFVSWAKNLLGRAYLDEGKPATAARTFLANYQDNPRGERAADSLFFLGQALLKLNKAADACKAYDELQDVYGETMRSYVKERLPAARAAARCR
ncbi:MAG TPA: tetratricopeptide repeat protein [Allosphingosinicella sp.]|nr:tetratricopeptide repeat protein [Allosphingosinicella sp.]